MFRACLFVFLIAGAIGEPESFEGYFFLFISFRSESADNKLMIVFIYFFFEKFCFSFHAKFLHAKPHSLKKKKIFQNVVCLNFTQHTKR